MPIVDPSGDAVWIVRSPVVPRHVNRVQRGQITLNEHRRASPAEKIVAVQIRGAGDQLKSGNTASREHVPSSSQLGSGVHHDFVRAPQEPTILQDHTRVHSDHQAVVGDGLQEGTIAKRPDGALRKLRSHAAAAKGAVLDECAYRVEVDSIRVVGELTLANEETPRSRKTEHTGI